MSDEKMREGSSMLKTEWKIWKTLHSGGMQKDALITQPAAAGFVITPCAKEMLAQESFTTTAQQLPYNIALVTVADLGFRHGAHVSRILDQERLKKMGLALCLPDLGVDVCFHYGDSAGETVFVAMEPIPDASGYPSIFCAYRHGMQFRLDGNAAYRDNTFAPSIVLAFVVSPS